MQKIYICDHDSRRILDIVIVSNNKSPGHTHARYATYYVPLIGRRVTWCNNPKYLKIKGFKQNDQKEVRGIYG